jgi:hypothetical protein
MSILLTHFKKIIALALAFLVFLMSIYVFFEPQIASAVSAGQNISVTLNVEAGISLTTTASTTMSTTLGAATNIAVGTTTVTVATNNPLGYTMTVTSSTSPAMKSSTDSVADYPQTTPNTWSVSSGQANFGFSVFGTDAQGGTATWGTGSYCNGASTSTVSTTLKYRGYSTSAITIAGRSSTTTPSGITTTLCHAVQQNNTYIPAGSYTATLTLTATTL